MGNFKAHIFPGSIFMLLGFWWFVNTLRNFYRKGSHIHHNSFPVLGKAWGEPLFKAVVCVTGMLVECNSASWTLIEAGEVHKVNDWQHITMYLLFLITAVSDILSVEFGKLGQSLSHSTYTMAFLLEAALFYFHTGDSPILDYRCHFLLVYTGWVMVLVLLYIQHFQSSLLATLFYHSMVIQHGAWFCGAGFILLSPFNTGITWDVTSPHHAMFACTIFVWIYLLILLVLLCIAVVTKRWTSRGPQVEGGRFEMEQLISSSDE